MNMAKDKTSLFGVSQKDINQARKISDKEYKRRVKRRKGDIDLYPVSNINKFTFIVKYIKNKGHEVSPGMVKKIAKKLHRSRKINDSTYKAVFQMSDKELLNKIING